jgi:uroporphyrin-III C-methyltransferase
VTLVGAGPGGPELITVAGARALAVADVVVYDRLADPALLDLAPVAAERIPAGKAKGTGASQDDINRLLVDRASGGSHVVRLKGGDPMLFGRGGEELDAVTRAEIPVTVIPGVSAALGAPALAGIPVTLRGEAASVTVVSGHRAADGSDDGYDGYDWDALARSASTIVVLMAASSAADVGRRLLGAGRPGSEPVAALHAAGTAASRTERLCLADLARRGCPFPAPTVLVVGAVAARVGGPQIGAAGALEKQPSVPSRGR